VRKAAGLLILDLEEFNRGTWSSARRRGASFSGAGGVAPVVEVVFSMRMLPFALAAAILIKECSMYTKRLWQRHCGRPLQGPRWLCR